MAIKNWMHGLILHKLRTLDYQTHYTKTSPVLSFISLYSRYKWPIGRWSERTSFWQCCFFLSWWYFWDLATGLPGASPDPRSDFTLWATWVDITTNLFYSEPLATDSSGGQRPRRIRWAETTQCRTLSWEKKNSLSSVNVQSFLNVLLILMTIRLRGALMKTAKEQASGISSLECLAT